MCFGPIILRYRKGMNDKSWAHLGFYRNNCFPEPFTCPNGITVSLWFKVSTIKLSWLVSDTR